MAPLKKTTTLINIANNKTTAIENTPMQYN